jgi:predicted DNA-binding antitoxin AbrB/MazE fold protein
MSITVDATYEDGVLKPKEPLSLAEHAQVRITILPPVSRVQESYGLLSWKGDPEILRRIACDDEFSILESP